MAIRFQEKRLFPRIRFSGPLRYAIRGVSEFSNAICDNLSTAGIGFINDKFIPPDTALMLEINILSRALNPIGRVTQSSYLPHTDTYRLGVEFLEIGLNEKRYLADYINMKMGKL